MTLREGLTEVRVQTLGAYLLAFQVRGKDVILQGAERQTRGGMAILIPFANRVKGGEYKWRGRTYRLPKNREGNAIHGLVMDREWSLDRVDGNNVSLSLLLEDPGYPEPLLIRTSYLLGENRLTWLAQVKNVGDHEAPLVVGTHPYFRVEGTWELSPAVGKKCISVERVPTGEMVDWVITPGEYDDCFLLPGELTLASSYSKLRIVRTNMDFIQLFTGIPGSVAVEPMSGAPDAFHNGMGLRVVNPGEIAEFSFQVTVLDLREDSIPR